MAFARLFGQSKRRDPPSPSGSTNSEEKEGEEGFTVVGDTRASNAAPPNDPFSYLTQLPYQLPNQGGYPPPGGAPPGGGGGVPRTTPSFQSQTSVREAPLDGVLFQLSPRLTTDSELEYMTTAVDSVMNKIKSMDWAAFDYNFSLERSVIANDVNIDGVNLN
jgi:hypothetical protein